MSDLRSLLNEQQVSKQLHVSLACLRRWRWLKQGPAFVKLGSAVRYRPEDLDAFVRENLQLTPEAAR
jgi:hypothetical protein